METQPNTTTTTTTTSLTPADIRRIAAMAIRRYDCPSAGLYCPDSEARSPWRSIGADEVSTETDAPEWIEVEAMITALVLIAERHPDTAAEIIADRSRIMDDLNSDWQ
jgi:hypothetical protein